MTDACLTAAVDDAAMHLFACHQKLKSIQEVSNLYHIFDELFDSAIKLCNIVWDENRNDTVVFGRFMPRIDYLVTFLSRFTHDTITDFCQTTRRISGVVRMFRTHNEGINTDLAQLALV
jgi:hypothetical protein